MTYLIDLHNLLLSNNLQCANPRSAERKVVIEDNNLENKTTSVNDTITQFFYDE